MVGNLYYKKHIEKLINANPTVINIKRTIKTPDGYKGYTETIEDITETVTFYKRRSNREFIGESGIAVGYMATSIEKILATGEANIKEGDIFKANNREYRVTFVNNYFDICKQIEVEVIQNEC